jgi:hypothetical protein
LVWLVVSYLVLLVVVVLVVVVLVVRDVSVALVHRLRPAATRSLIRQ